MFVQNQIKDLPNHQDVITNALANAGEALFVVAYIKETGVDMILDGLKNKPVKLLCSFDMGITQLSGIKKLLENHVEVRVYKRNQGTFHPKTWLFKHGNKWQVLVGSANLTRAALVNNVEASVLLDDENITTTAVMFFNYLWNVKNSYPVTLQDIDRLQKQLAQRRLQKQLAQRRIQKQLAQLRKIKTDSAQLPSPYSDEEQKIKTLFTFIKIWIDISKWKQGITSSLWRGWYIIPDHGLVNDKLAYNLASYLPLIGDEIKLQRSIPNKQYNKLLDKFVKNSNFKRSHLKLSDHDLFVRQAKNYLIKFGWVYHPLVERKKEYKPDKTILLPTDLGRRIAQCQNVKEVRQLYSEHFEDYNFNGLLLVNFVRRLLERFGTLNLDEFDYFVTHAYSDNDMDVISELITIYRSCKNKKALKQQVAEYFKEIKEPTAKNVQSNYIKNVKHTMSAIGWCRGFSMSEDFVIQLSDDAN